MGNHIHWAPLIVALGVGLITWFVAHSFRLNERWKASTSPSQGFAGWLLFLALLQGLTAIHAFGDIFTSISLKTHATAASSTPLGAGYTAAIVIRVLMFIFVLGSTIMMLRRSRLFPRLFRIEMVLLLVFPIVVALLTTWEIERSREPHLLSVLAWIRVAIFAPAAGIGYVYSLRSQRFRNTFVR